MLSHTAVCKNSLTVNSCTVKQVKQGSIEEVINQWVFSNAILLGMLDQTEEPKSLNGRIEVW